MSNVVFPTCIEETSAGTFVFYGMADVGWGRPPGPGGLRTCAREVSPWPRSQWRRGRCQDHDLHRRRPGLDENSVTLGDLSWPRPVVDLDPTGGGDEQMRLAGGQVDTRPGGLDPYEQEVRYGYGVDRDLMI